jgi:hypothetical protein
LFFQKIFSTPAYLFIIALSHQNSQSVITQPFHFLGTTCMCIIGSPTSAVLLHISAPSSMPVYVCIIIMAQQLSKLHPYQCPVIFYFFACVIIMTQSPSRFIFWTPYMLGLGLCISSKPVFVYLHYFVARQPASFHFLRQLICV